MDLTRLFWVGNLDNLTSYQRFTVYVRHPILHLDNSEHTYPANLLQQKHTFVIALPVVEKEN